MKRGAAYVDKCCLTGTEIALEDADALGRVVDVQQWHATLSTRLVLDADIAYVGVRAGIAGAIAIVSEIHARVTGHPEHVAAVLPQVADRRGSSVGWDATAAGPRGTSPGAAVAEEKPRKRSSASLGRGRLCRYP